jgi:hypothetical protein
MQTAPSATTRAIPYTFFAPGHAAIQSGSCAGLILQAAPSLTVRRGQRLSVQVMHEQDGRLDVPIPKPTTPAIKILSQPDASATYEAVFTGTVVLLAHHTRFCGTSARFAICAALGVRVVP